MPIISTTPPPASTLLPSSRWVAWLVPLSLVACGGGPEEFSDTATSDGPQSEDASIDVDDRPVIAAAVAPPPIMGGTLHMTADGARAIVADPDRDQVHVVDLAHAVETDRIVLDPGTRPCRIAEGPEGEVYVVLRGMGAVARIDIESATVQATTPVCAQPRGIDVDEVGDVWVACAGGELVTLRGDEVVTRQDIDPDARDVLHIDGVPWVSRFRSARVGPVGGEALGLPNISVGDDFDTQVERLHPSVAWRTRSLPGGRFLMLHQGASDRSIRAAMDGRDDDGGDGGGTGDDGGGDAAYGGAGRPCDRLVHAVVSVGDGSGSIVSSGPLSEVLGAVDVAADPQTGRIAVAVSGSPEDRAGLGVVVLGESDLRANVGLTCTTGFDPGSVEGQAVAVAFDQFGRLYVQSREPGILMRFDLDTGGQWRIPLSGDTRFDTGHELFHRDTGSGISCASCHPEGGDDGRRWNFIDLGARHTPALDVGLAGTEPFHWQGDLPDFTALVDEVFVARMGASAQSPARAEALGSWVFAQRSGPARVGDPDAVARGEASFTALGCDACHATGAAPPTDFGFGFALQSPPLSGVGLHPPYMHDGRAATLADAVRDMVARTRPQQHPTAAEVADLVAYLQTL